jgi:hypothetical protein
MRQIKRCMEYDGGPILEQVLYSGPCRIPLESGRYVVRVFGEVSYNGILLKDEVALHGGDLDVKEDAAVLFVKAPAVPQETPEGFEPVPDVPDFMSEAEQSIYGMVQEVLRRSGLVPAEGEAKPSSPPEDTWDDDTDDDENLLVGPISNVTLLPVDQVVENRLQTRDSSVTLDSHLSEDITNEERDDVAGTERRTGESGAGPDLSQESGGELSDEGVQAPEGNRESRTG